MADDYAYLEPEFNPSTLTMPQLRSILVANNVAYPSSAKKPDLVGLFNNNVATQAGTLRNARSRVQRSTRGIVDVPSSQASTVDEDEMPPAPSTARRSTRRITRSRQEESAEVSPPPEETFRTPATTRRPSSRRSRVEREGLDGADDSGRLTSSRKPRQSVPAAVVRQPEPEPEPEPEPVYPPGAESPFTSDNPFQSGSSPPSGIRSKSSGRRTTLGQAGDKSKSRELRRRTDGHTAREEDGTVSQSFEMPVARVKHQLPKEEEEHVTETLAGEEFTPEEQLDLVRARAHNGEMDILPPRRKKQIKKTGVSRGAPWIVLATMLGGIATVWRQEKIRVGYCGVGEPSTALAGVEIPDWASFIQPQCEPCPQHAYCGQELSTTCEPDFVLTPHPLSLGGLVPLAPNCEPDSDKVRKIKTVADHAIDNELRVRNAQYECGERKSPDFSEEELKQAISAKRSRKMTDEEFNDLWEPAFEEMLGREEVVSKVEGLNSTRLLRSNSLARISLSCSIRRSLLLALRQNLQWLIILLTIIFSSGYGRHRYITYRSTSVRAKELAGYALDNLATQASLHATDPIAYPEPYISMTALRDDVLREEFNAKERVRIWDVVKGLVEGNANVRSMVRESRTGEVSRVWEWIGAVHMIEGVSPGNASRRESGRFGLGGAGRVADSPGRLTDVKAEDEDGKMLVRGQVQKWDEGGRPYY